MAELTREAIPASERWDLTHLFPSVEAWEAERAALQAELPGLEALQGSLHHGPAAVLQALTRSDQIGERLERLFAYAALERDLDTRQNAPVQRYEQAMSLAVAAGRASAWIAPELLTLSDDELRGLLDQEPALAPYARLIERTIRERPHIRSAEVEEVLAASTEMAHASENVFTFLDNADIEYGNVVDSEGNEVKLTKGRYQRFLESHDRRLRRDAYQALYVPYLAHRNTLGALLTATVQRDAFYARARRYPSSLEAALQPEAIPTSVYTNLIQTIHQHLPLLHRYIALRKRVLGVDDLHTYDLYVPLVEMPERDYAYEEARQTVLHALAPLGSPYTDVLSTGLHERWSDVYETSGKRSGAYSFGVYGAHPFMLLNWTSALNDVFTLAHEAGHAMHSYLSNTTQPHPTADYTIFVAEVASTFNEQLLTADLLAHTDDPKERAYLINDALETFRGTVYRQTMFAEFELLIHQIVESGEGLTPERLTAEYARLVGEYYGPELLVDEQVAVEWSRIPHFYRAYYVYQYATGLIASMALAAAVSGQQPQARERYLRFLSSGSSKDSLELLQAAGVDLTTEVPYAAAFQTVERYLDELERLL